MRILITGARGMLGQHLGKALSHHDLTLATREMLDITRRGAVYDAVFEHDLVVNAAAYTNVDLAESDEEQARVINAVAVEHLAHASAAAETRLIQVSTDYVFDGTASRPYAESTPCNPRTAYGRTKALGEAAALTIHPEGSIIVRTAWLYGRYGKNFAATMLRLANSQDSIDVVSDQIGQPTWTWDLARQIRLIIDSRVPPGIMHGTNSGQASWFEFARAIFEESGLDPERIRPISSAQMPRPAPRPAYSVLDHSRWEQLGLTKPRQWREALNEASSEGF
ncbi:dTDP-4-dehydrorhamnose reductase [Paramicrobacterium fandaimingii]|uniref:dTDP-4-dehydrorhamnose reductase n=1 Tax=Paramicrobacterium fandaimingii TaxID=2708079 RepID=UPI00141ED32B|nr:dTDP-4-dehydrorhamnose reductase [Microbacterium fandaimingii]